MGKQFKATVSEIPRDIPLNEIFENPQNPRKYFDEIQELADNIKAVGLLQPIRVRPVDGGHQIVHGHRRYHAVEMLGWETIPATVTTMSDREAYEISLSENLLRADLSAIEEAEGFRHLMNEFGCTQEQIAKRFGKTQQFISSRLSLLNLPEDIQWKITTRVVPASHGELLAKIDNAELQMQIADEVEQGKLSVRQLERRIGKIKQSAEQPKPYTQDAIGESEELSEPSESGKQESTEQPQEAEVIEVEEPEPAPRTVEEATTTQDIDQPAEVPAHGESEHIDEVEDESDKSENPEDWEKFNECWDWIRDYALDLAKQGDVNSASRIRMELEFLIERLDEECAETEQFEEELSEKVHKRRVKYMGTISNGEPMRLNEILANLNEMEGRNGDCYRKGGKSYRVGLLQLKIRVARRNTPEFDALTLDMLSEKLTEKYGVPIKIFEIDKSQLNSTTTS